MKIGGFAGHRAAARAGGDRQATGCCPVFLTRTDTGRVAQACGPPAMLESARAICAELGVPAQLALESGMACGFGACFGCVVPTRDGYVRLCVDGPVIEV